MPHTHDEAPSGMASGTPVPGEAASAYVTDALDRAQRCFPRMTDPATPKHEAPLMTAWFTFHTTVAILLENLRRLDPALADRLTEWALTEDGIFTDSYSGELVHEWREQIAAGRPMNPIGPDLDDAPTGGVR